MVGRKVSLFSWRYKKSRSTQWLARQTQLVCTPRSVACSAGYARQRFYLSNFSKGLVDLGIVADCRGGRPYESVYAQMKLLT